MKKVFLFLAAAAMIFAGCKNNEELGVQEATETQFTVSLQPRQSALKAPAEDNKFVDEVVLIVWDYVNEKEYTRVTNTGADLKLEADGTITTTFKLALQLGNYYEYLFWADNAGYYDLTKPDSIVAIKSMAKANDIKRDAFCTMWKDENKYTNPIVKNFTLTRPFAQFNLVATDLTKAIRDAEYPNNNLKFAIEYKGYQGGINLLESTDIMSDDLVTINDTVTAFYDTTNSQTIVIMDYLWMPISEDKYLTDIAFESILPTEFNRTFTNIPFQRNYKTNLIGELFHSSSVFTVTVDPTWDGSDTIPYSTAQDVAAANAMFAKGATEATIFEVGDVTEIVLPNIEAEVKITFLTLDKNVSFAYSSVEGAKKPTVVTITTDAASKIDATALTESKINWSVNSQAILDKVMNAVAANNIITFSKEGEYVLNSPLKEGVVINGNDNATLYFASTYTINVDNVVLNDLIIKGNASNGSTSGTISVSKSATFNNCTMINSSSRMIVVGGEGTTINFNDCDWNTEGKGRGIMAWGGSPTINIDGCTFDCVYPFNVDGGTPNFTVTNSTLNGWTSYTETATVSFENCEFGKSTSGYPYCRPYSSTTFTNCEFSEDYLLDFGAAGIVLTLTDCTQGGQPVTVAIINPDDLQAQGTLVINGVTVYPQE